MKADKVAITAVRDALLARTKIGKPFVSTYLITLQARRFVFLGGKQYCCLVVGGEPVVDYALKFQEVIEPENVGRRYCNASYELYPSLRVLKEEKPPLKVPRWWLRRQSLRSSSRVAAARWDDVEE